MQWANASKLARRARYFSDIHSDAATYALALRSFWADPSRDRSRLLGPATRSFIGRPETYLL